ncbi:MAG: hypothetical protein O3A00_13265 [Planctomycetota bacterium]|nr:hypothetical protein [Planctomycetota bacterium]
MPLNRICLLAMLTWSLTSTGCAALSLFGATHQHTHYDNPNTQNRLDGLEQRISRLEGGVTHVPASIPLPLGQPASGVPNLPQFPEVEGAAIDSVGEQFPWAASDPDAPSNASIQSASPKLMVTSLPTESIVPFTD